MGRVKEFKHEEALNKAMYLFWEQGYENTSLKELLEEMNILNGSFYNCFKNKKNLFKMTLDHYAQTYAVFVTEKFDEHSSFKVAIRELIHNSLLCENIDRPQGCFLINCATSALIDDPDMGSSIREKVNGFYSFIGQKFIQAQARGELEASLDANKTVSLILSYLHGRMKLIKFFPHNDESKEQIEYFLESLGV